eukprot:COSAG01_NODE_34703_length_543_cov_1.101351_1_plen_123_part_00
MLLFIDKDKVLESCVMCTDDVKLDPIKLALLAAAAFSAIYLLGFATRPQRIDLEARCVILFGRCDSCLGQAMALRRPIAQQLRCLEEAVHTDDEYTPLEHGDRVFVFGAKGAKSKHNVSAVV